MAIQQPAGPLWDAVTAFHGLWPADDEVVAADMANAWRGGSEVLAQGARATGDAGDASLAAWPDPAGVGYGDRVRAHGAEAGTLQQRLNGRAAHADHYSTELTSAKTAIVDTIARNEQAYARLGDPILGAAGPARQAEFAATIAAALQTMITQKADALRGYPVDPDPDDPGDRDVPGPYPPTPSFTDYPGRPRDLTPAEEAIAREVFGDSLDLGRVEIAEGGTFTAGGIPRALPGVIHLPEDRVTGTNDPAYRKLLVHELTHIWQYQRGGNVFGLGWTALRGWFDPSLYEYGGVGALPGKALDDFNTEQQAEIFADYYAELQKPRPDLEPFKLVTDELAKPR